MLPGSLSGEPRYASILWADDQGISSEIFRSLSFFNSSRGTRGIGVRCPQQRSTLGVRSLSSKSSGSRSGDRGLRRRQSCRKRTMRRRRRTVGLKTPGFPRGQHEKDQEEKKAKKVTSTVESAEPNVQSTQEKVEEKQDHKAEENKHIKTLPEPSETSSEGEKSSEGKSAKKVKTASGTLKVFKSLDCYFRIFFREIKQISSHAPLREDWAHF